MISYFTIYLALNLLVKEFLKFVNIWQSYSLTGKKVIVSCAPLALHFCTQRC